MPSASVRQSYLDEHIVKLLQYKLPERLSLLLFELVKAISRPQSADLRRSQARFQVDLVVRGNNFDCARPGREALRFPHDLMLTTAFSQSQLPALAFRVGISLP